MASAWSVTVSSSGQLSTGKLSEFRVPVVKWSEFQWSSGQLNRVPVVKWSVKIEFKWLLGKNKYSNCKHGLSIVQTEQLEGIGNNYLCVFLPSWECCYRGCWERFCV